MNRRSFNIALAGTLGALSPPTSILASTIPQPWIQHCGVQLWRFSSSAYFFKTQHIAVDADGAPDAYSPLNEGRDDLLNAGFPNGDWQNVLIQEPKNLGHPYKQTSGAFVGYYLSKTALADPNGKPTDPTTYADAESVPYLVIPGGDFYKTNGTGAPGDLVMALDMTSNMSSSAVIGDIGGANDQLGEISIKLAENLGGQNVNPRTARGAPKGDFLYIVFPKTRTNPAWPRTTKSIDDNAKYQLSLLGGWEPLRKIVN